MTTDLGQDPTLPYVLASGTVVGDPLRGLRRPPAFGSRPVGAGVELETLLGDPERAGRQALQDGAIVAHHEPETVERPQHAEQELPRVTVEVVRGFVAEQHLRLLRQGGSDQPPLALARRQLAGQEPEQGRFARPVLADDPDPAGCARSNGDIEVDLDEDGQGGGVGMGDPMQVHGRHGNIPRVSGAHETRCDLEGRSAVLPHQTLHRREQARSGGHLGRRGGTRLLLRGHAVGTQATRCTLSARCRSCENQHIVAGSRADAARALLPPPPAREKQQLAAGSRTAGARDLADPGTSWARTHLRCERPRRGRWAYRRRSCATSVGW